MNKLNGIFLLGCFGLIGCGSGNHDFTGSYSGTETGTVAGVSFSQTLKFSLSQAGDAVSGSYTSGSGGIASISGASDHDSISNISIKSTAGCAGTLIGSAKKTDSDGISGSVSGSSTCGTINLNFTLGKE